MIYNTEDINIHRYCVHGHLDKIKKLKPNLDSLPYKQLAFDHACTYGQLETAKHLDIHMKDLTYNTAFGYAAEFGHLDICKWLWSEHKDNINVHWNEDYAFVQAALNGHGHILDFIGRLN